MCSGVLGFRLADGEVLCIFERRRATVGALRHYYVMMREWCLARIGMLDPCSGSDNISSVPFQLLGKHELGRSWVLVLRTYLEGIVLAIILPFQPCAAFPCGEAVRVGLQGCCRVSHRAHLYGSSGS